MSVKFKGNFSRVDGAIKKALNPASVEFAKKANKYAYYLGTPSKEHNPDAEQRWGEVAKTHDMQDIIRVAQNAIKENL